MEQTTFNQREGRRFSCPGCGGGLQYDIPSGRLKCDHCGQLTEIGAMPEESDRESTMEVMEFRCPQCGAAVYSSGTSATSFCSFCGSDVVLTAKLTRTRRPARIVPFSITREQCEQKYREYLGSFHLVPSTLKSAETISHFRPVYVPFWSYHVVGEGPSVLKGTKSYTRGDTRYDETYDLDVDAKIDQRDILYDASTVFEDETAAMLKHTTDRAVDFHPAYLSGFYAQVADVRPEEYYAETEAAALRLFLSKIKDSTKMDTVEPKNKNYKLPNPKITQQLVMLPVWLLAHREGDRVVYTAVNGRSGEVVCDVPVAMMRVIGVAAGIAAGLFILLQLFLTLKPDLLLLLCALLSLITQYRFSAMHELLFNRRTRAFEPDFSGSGKRYVGPAQMLLNRRDKKQMTAGKIISRIMSCIGAAIVVMGLAVNSDGLYRIINKLENTPQMIVLVALLVMLVIMVIHTARRVQSKQGGPAVPRIVSCVACAAGFLCLLTGQVEDIYYYACAAVLLLAAIWELSVITGAHNEYASRPVPYFDGKEARI